MLYLLATAAFLATAFSGFLVERPDSHTTEWTELGPTDPDQQIKLLFALKNENLDALHDTLMAVSTPGSSEYGQFKDVSEMRELIAPSKHTVITILEWLTEYRLEYVIHTSNDDLFTVETSIEITQNLLNCEYYDYKSNIDQTTVVSRVKIGTDYFVESRDIANSLWFVSPTHRFPFLAQRLQVTGLGAGEMNPTKLRALYNLGDAAGMASNNSQGIASFRDQYYDIKDVQMMWKNYDIQSCNVTNVPVDEPSGHHLEAELDTQYISSMGQKVAMQVWWTQGINFLDAMMEFTENVLKDPNAPPLFSVSYGGAESQFGLEYVTKLNSQFALMGTAGVTVMFASGDSGAGGGCTGPASFEPDYPACSPYVTAVGGVTGGTAGKTPVGESAWQDGGGGFSNYAGLQSWQTDAVNYYLNNENLLPDKSKYNASGRGFPDIAAQSVDFLIYVNGKGEGVSGTSCASPTAGGVFALLNDLRLQNKMPVLGFMNPFIYATAAKDPTAFNDCTEGYNKGCGLSKGFEAFPKWDPASGYGSPDYKVLSTHVMETGRQALQNM